MMKPLIYLMLAAVAHAGRRLQELSCADKDVAAIEDFLSEWLDVYGDDTVDFEEYVYVCTCEPELIKCTMNYEEDGIKTVLSESAAFEDGQLAYTEWCIGDLGDTDPYCERTEFCDGETCGCSLGSFDCECSVCPGTDFLSSTCGSGGFNTTCADELPGALLSSYNFTFASASETEKSAPLVPIIGGILGGLLLICVAIFAYRATPETTPTMERENGMASLADTAYEFSQETSMHGIAFVFNWARYKRWKRLLWLALLLTCLGLMVWQISNLISQFRDYEVVTTIKTIIPDSLKFPAVTICLPGLNREKEKLQDLANSVSWTGPLRGFLPRTDEEILQVATPLESAIQGALFNKAVLDIGTNFETVITTAGVCFQFQTDETVFRGGRGGGLNFGAYFNESDYYDISSNFGLAVYIHQEGTQITDETRSVLLQPGETSNVRIESKRFVRETELPWSTCKSKAPEYTQSQCRADCLTDAIAERCGCRRFFDNRHSDLGTCNDTIADTVNGRSCFTDVTVDIENVLSRCDCRQPPCYEEFFPAFVSSFPFSQGFREAFAARFPDFSYWDNYFSVWITFDSIMLEEFGETKAMTYFDLLAAIGGSMGLFAGISIISIVELLVDLGIMRLLPRCWGDRRRFGLGSIPVYNPVASEEEEEVDVDSDNDEAAKNSNTLSSESESSSGTQPGVEDSTLTPGSIEEADSSRETFEQSRVVL